MAKRFIFDASVNAAKVKSRWFNGPASKCSLVLQATRNVTYVALACYSKLGTVVAWYQTDPDRPNVSMTKSDSYIT